MTSIQYYDSPFGRIRMEADEVGLTGLWFEGSKYDRLPNEYLEQETEILLAGLIKKSNCLNWSILPLYCEMMNIPWCAWN